MQSNGLKNRSFVSILRKRPRRNTACPRVLITGINQISINCRNTNIQQSIQVEIKMNGYFFFSFL